MKLKCDMCLALTASKYFFIEPVLMDGVAGMPGGQIRPLLESRGRLDFTFETMLLI